MGVQAGTLLHVCLMLREVSAARRRPGMHVDTQTDQLQSCAESAHRNLFLLYETTWLRGPCRAGVYVGVGNSPHETKVLLR